MFFIEFPVQDDRQWRLAAIRALREEQAAKNRELAEQRKRKIEQLNTLEEARKRRAEEIAIARAALIEAPRKRKGEEKDNTKRLLAEKEAQLVALRKQLEEATKDKDKPSGEEDNGIEDVGDAQGTDAEGVVVAASTNPEEESKEEEYLPAATENNITSPTTDEAALAQ